MQLDVGMIREVGLLGAIAILAFKLYVSKDVQQNAQNDLLVQNLMESNKKKDELLERTVSNFEKTMDSIVKKLEDIDKKIG
ncbi:MAG: hypothetical protein ACRCXX_09945, partial [Cetobacterium sp.]|uniref:hypothetical protein n=1 Tax=unclassified Cetobacterium TaxID=2630983 RepID=UPI000647FE96|nr:hypothetical protein [Cetobacterium sp. ZOR0034]